MVRRCAAAVRSGSARRRWGGRAVVVVVVVVASAFPVRRRCGSREGVGYLVQANGSTRGTRACQVVVGHYTWARGGEPRVEGGRITRDQPYATVTALPLQLNWAATVHRAQGLCLEHVHVDIPRVYASGQVYTALSRARTLSGLSLASIPKQSVVAGKVRAQARTSVVVTIPCCPRALAEMHSVCCTCVWRSTRR